MAKVTPLQGKVPQPPQLQVVSTENSDLFSVRNFERYNPDLLAQRKGGLGIYAKMMQDEQVKAVAQFKKLSILGRGYHFVFSDTQLSEEEQHTRVCVMEQTVRQMRGSFTDALVATLRAYQNGYSMQEIVTDTIEVEGASYVGVNQILSRDVASFFFYTDDYGQLIKLTQKVGSKEVELDYDKFLHYVQNPEEDAYYGQSELRAAYRSWFMKDTAIKFWMQYLERMAGGFAAISLGDSGVTQGSPDYRALQSMLTNLRSTMGILLPNGATMELITPATTDAYQKAVEFHDLAIAKSMLIPNLLGLSNSGQTGAFAQSQTQLEVYFMTIAADSQRLEQCLNDQLFKMLAAQNWEDGEFPRFRFKDASAEQVKWMVETFQKLVTGNAVIPTEADEAWLRKLLNAPERDATDTPLVTPQQKLDAQAATHAQGLAGDAQAHQRQMDIRAADNADAQTAVAQTVADAKVKTTTGRKAFTDDGAGKGTRTKVQMTVDALRRVDFAVVASRATAIEQNASADVARLSARAARRAIPADRLPELLDQDTQDIGDLKFDSSDVGKIKAAFRTMLDRAWAVGLTQAMDETGKIRKVRYADDVRTVKFADLRGKAAEYFDSNAFRMAGNLTDGMRAIIQQELLKGVRAGTRPEEVAAGIYDRLIRKGFTTLEALQAEEPRDEVLTLTEQLLSDALGVANVPAYLNTLARTNTFEAMNEARYAEFTDPAVADFVEALEFSAILDDRTTEICTEMDGHIHAVDSAVWDTYRPPLHYNCRSLLVAITTLDGWDGQESDIPTVEPQDGF